MKITKYFIAASLAVILLAPGSILAQSYADLQAQINLLLKQVAVLQAQLLTVQSGASLATSTSTVPSLSVTLDSSTPPARQVAMSSANLSLADFRFTNTSSNEAVAIQRLTITETATGSMATVPGFTNVKLFSGGVQIAGPTEASSTGYGRWTYVFNINNAVVPQGSSLIFDLRGDVFSYTSGSAQSNKIYNFSIATGSDVSAYGQSTANKATVNIYWNTSNPITTLRTKLTMSSSVIGTTSWRSNMPSDDLANLVFTANPSYDATVNKVALTFSGTAVSSSPFTVALIDPNTGTDWGTGTRQTCYASSSYCTVTFAFMPGATPTITAGTSKTVIVRIDSSSFGYSPGGNNLSVYLAGTNSIDWGDGTTLSGLGLEPTVVPLTIASVIYGGSLPTPTPTPTPTSTPIIATPTPSIVPTPTPVTTPSMEVADPAAASIIGTGSPATISFRWKGALSNLNIYLQQFNGAGYDNINVDGPYGSIAFGVLPGVAAGSFQFYTWQVPTYLTSSSGYRIEICGTFQNASSSYVCGDGPNFSIQAPFISVTNPKAGAIVTVGQPLTISWDAAGITSAFNISLMKGTILQSIGSAGSSMRSFTWTPPASTATSSSYRIYISGSASGTPKSAMSPLFTISSGSVLGASSSIDLQALANVLASLRAILSSISSVIR